MHPVSLMSLIISLPGPVLGYFDRYVEIMDSDFGILAFWNTKLDLDAIHMVVDLMITSSGKLGAKTLNFSLW